MNIFGAVTIICIPMLLVMSGSAPSSPATITVSAAASLTDAMGEIASEFEKANPGIDVELNLASSGSLRLQIEAGAPVDVFASASENHMDILAEKGLIDSRYRKDFAENTLVLVVPGNGNTITSIDDLTDKNIERIAIGNPQTAPVGRYAQQSLIESELWDRLEDKMIYAESVKQVLTYVERGEVDAGFVYMTDVSSAQPNSIDVVCEVPVSVSIRYPIAVISSTSHKTKAQDFVHFVTGEKGREILHSHGFKLLALSADKEVV
jgi:molybdate transport system substrate-binding protein